MSSQTVATIDVAALGHNLRRVRHYAPASAVLSVVKANAYGHGLATVIEALHDTDAFAVGTLAEAIELRKISPDKAIVILQGAADPADLSICQKNNFQPVIHSPHQIEDLRTISAKPLKCWLKINTGMRRLGLAAGDYDDTLKTINNMAATQKPLVLMSHFACADEPDRMENRHQINLFQPLLERHDGETSFCNSAATIAFPEVHGDWVRPGIMLYGISPMKDRTAAALNLRPVMTLTSRLIAVYEARAGDNVGYGATWQCPENMRIGVIGIGYGDGYPRHAPNGTPVVINGRRSSLVGRVSMDMLTVDLRNQPDARPGDEVVLWGEGLPIEDIAEAAGTIAYELVCRLTGRVDYQLKQT